MKLLLLLFALVLNSAIAQKFSFAGSLLNLENEVISRCIVKSDLNTFSSENITLAKINYLDKEVENINLRFYIKNGIGGNLFIGEVGKVKFIFNTDSMDKILEVSILDLKENYKCTHFNEK